MGDVVSLTGFRQYSKEASQKDSDYDKLKTLERELFGESKQGHSFLELIVGGAEQPPKAGALEPVNAATELLSLDLLRTPYLKFENYDLKRYGDFLYTALVYLYRHEPRMPVPKDRIKGVARQLFRHSTGLPKLSEPELINEYKKTMRGRISYRYREWKVHVRLRIFEDEAVLEANGGYETTVEEKK
ncbi:hypothetical protein JW898_05875 [Candidatus Woesearchaeota archaeon]|nr:hypothetical protein [Candidatus Woesearchaeota archaeon]